MNVVAIIGVLVAISIPIFTAQLKKARIATNQANARAAYAAATADYLTNNDDRGGTYVTSSGTFTGSDSPTAGSVTGFSTDIASWADSDDDIYSSTTYGTWVVVLDENGSVSSYSATE